MAISINPVSPVAAAQQAGGVAPELVLQPGTVVNAQVLQVLSADLVRIAIANLTIEVGTQIPLLQGQALQLAVSQNSDGIRLEAWALTRRNPALRQAARDTTLPASVQAAASRTADSFRHVLAAPGKAAKTARGAAAGINESDAPQAVLHALAILDNRKHSNCLALG